MFALAQMINMWRVPRRRSVGGSRGGAAVMYRPPGSMLMRPYRFKGQYPCSFTAGRLVSHILPTLLPRFPSLSPAAHTDIAHANMTHANRGKEEQGVLSIRGAQETGLQLNT